MIFICIHGEVGISLVLFHITAFSQRNKKKYVFFKVNENKANTGIVIVLSNKTKYIYFPKIIPGKWNNEP